MEAACPAESPLARVLGDVDAFLDAVLAQLRSVGLNPVARGWEVDHICYRCASAAEYRAAVDALVPTLGTLLVESMVGGRPISCVRLHRPIEHAGLRVGVVEIPAPKAGSPYASGLEHAEVVVGTPEDGCLGHTALRRFAAACAADGVALPLPPLPPPSPEADAECNAELGVSWQLAWGAHAAPRKVSVKFHARPLEEVVAYELQHGLAQPPPPDYWAGRE